MRTADHPPAWEETIRSYGWPQSLLSSIRDANAFHGKGAVNRALPWILEALRAGPGGPEAMTVIESIERLAYGEWRQRRTAKDGKPGRRVLVFVDDPVLRRELM